MQVSTNFSFLRGASHPYELVIAAKALGLRGLAVTDRNTLAGVVRTHVAAKEHGLALTIGTRLDLEDGPSLLVYPGDRAAYGRLTRLITKGQRRVEKGNCELHLADVFEAAAGQILAVVPPEEVDDEFSFHLKKISQAIDNKPYIVTSFLYRGDDRARLGRLRDVARGLGLAMLATNDVHAHVPTRRDLADVLTAIREGVRVDAAGRRLQAHGERYLKVPAEMYRLFRGHEDMLRAGLDIQERCRFSLDELRYEYPEDPVPKGQTPQSWLAQLTAAGAMERYPLGVPGKVEAQIRYELALIDELGYAPYFLTVHDIVRFARERGILCQGRGSAANSTVCYCIGITSVDPAQMDLLFERFISAERNEPPDIDVDFEHERREEVIQYLYARYGRERASLAATVVSYRSRSAIREVGKVMGLSVDTVGALAGMIWGRSGQGVEDDQAREAGLNPEDPLLAKTLELTRTLVGFPRHLSQHVGGFVLTRGPLDEVVVIGNAAMADRTFIEWDKDDLDALGILKIDILALGMLTCIRKCFDMMRDEYGLDYSLATLPKECAQMYRMLQRADSVGVFQVESRAQMNMLPRLRPEKFYDLVIEVAIVRPGPIQGDMVHPYLRRRRGEEAVEFPSPDPAFGPADELEQVLGKTLGVPLFQEQAMRIAIVAAGFTPAEADRLRRAMATFRRMGTINSFRAKLVDGMTSRGYDKDFAERCFKQIEGFGEYGFPESHAASFALLVYASSWIKCHYPEVFAAGLLNSQPMGFYAPAQIVRDAREHGVTVLGVDVNFSAWDNLLELETGKERRAVRLGFRQIKGLREEALQPLVDLRGAGYRRMDELHRRTGLSPAVLERLAAADCFRSLGLDRRQALWDVRALKGHEALPLFERVGVTEEGAESIAVQLPLMPLAEHVVNDYQTLRLSLKAHPLSFLRDGLRASGCLDAGAVRQAPHGARVSYAGAVLLRQRPGSAKGVVFMTLEDEVGVVNAVIWPKVFEKYRKVVLASRLIRIRGRVERHGDILHLMAEALEDYSDRLLSLGDDVNHGNHDAGIPRHQQTPRRHPRDVTILPPSRDFH